ncbi:hypothetical protein Ae201684P_004254 [Aphanomyces euteiches]|nr:hypothetical protein Ae201684P_004254 [Aphanomyces euteiches]
MHEDEDPSTLCAVFEQMLQVNEDLLAAVAEQQQWNGDPTTANPESALAYQRLLHKNLVEMADFVDSLCGVFVSVDKSSESPRSKKPRTADEIHAKEPSLLLSTLQANESLRARRRSEKTFLSYQKKIKEQEDYDKLPLPLMYPPPSLHTPPPPPFFTLPPAAPLPPNLMLRPCPLPLPPAIPIAPGKNRLVVAKEECLSCHRLGKSVKACRTIWKHTTPSWKNMMPPPPPPMMAAMPMPLLWSQPLIPFPIPLATTNKAPARKAFKRVCERCKNDHQSLYQCRTVLQHTDPEWKREESGGEAAASHRSYSRWTDVEMKTFHELVEVHGYRDVSKLAFYLQTKDKKQVKSYLQVLEIQARQRALAGSMYQFSMSSQRTV